MDKLKAVLTRRDDPEQANITEDDRGFISDALDASTLSYSTRIKGFVACFVLGVLISILSSVLYALTFNLVTFSILYTLGNVVALASTCFLMGPVNQIKKMFAPTRWSNDGRDVFFSNYDRTCLWSADIFTSVWQDNL